MNDMLKTIEPKSDQLNADDLIGGRTMTVKITKVSILAGEQPVALHYEGDNGKPYKPCKSMRRVIVNVWGADANLYTGRSMMLYRDEEVQFGGLAVGGLRISHMSDIGEPATIALTVTRARRKPYTVMPLGEPRREGFNKLARGNAAAERGMKSLEAFWASLSNTDRLSLGAAQLASWKRIAADVNDNGVYDPETEEIVNQTAAAGAEASPQGHTGLKENGPALAADQTGELAARPLAAKLEERAAGLDPSDPKLQALLDAGRTAATSGKAKHRRWENNLSAPDFERLGPHLDELRNAAAAADGERA